MKHGFVGMYSIWGTYGYTCKTNLNENKFQVDREKAAQEFMSHVKRNALIFDKILIDEQEYKTLVENGVHEIPELLNRGFFEMYTSDNLCNITTDTIGDEEIMIAYYDPPESIAFIEFGKFLLGKKLFMQLNKANNCEPNSKEYQNTLNEYFRIGEKLHDYIFTGNAMLYSKKNSCEVVPIVTSCDRSDFFTSLYSEFLQYGREHFDEQIIKLIERVFDPSVYSKNISKADTVKTIAGSIALPDQSVEWSQIFDYREDEDVKRTFLGIKKWMRKMVEEELHTNELLEEIDYLTAEYRHYMNVHRMKIGHGKFSSILTIPTQIIESLISGNILKGLRDITGGIFGIANANVALAEAELKAPGREIAYIINSSDKFG